MHQLPPRQTDVSRYLLRARPYIPGRSTKGVTDQATSAKLNTDEYYEGRLHSPVY